MFAQLLAHILLLRTKIIFPGILEEPGILLMCLPISHIDNMLQDLVNSF